MCEATERCVAPDSDLSVAPHTKCVISVRPAERKMVDYLAEKINSMGPPYWDTPKTAAAGPPRASAGLDSGVFLHGGG